MLNKVGYEIYIISLGSSVMMGTFLVRKLHRMTYAIAPSPNGKAQEFDSCMYWFESSRGSSKKKDIK